MRFDAGGVGRLAVAPDCVGWPVIAFAINRDDLFQIGQVSADLVDHAVEILADEQDLHTGVRQDELDLRRGKARIHRRHRRARLGRAEHHLVIDRCVLREIADAVICLDAERDQAVCNLSRPGLKLGKAGGFAFEPERGCVRTDAGLDTRNIRQMRHRLNVDHVLPPDGVLFPRLSY